MKIVGRGWRCHRTFGCISSNGVRTLIVIVKNNGQCQQINVFEIGITGLFNDRTV